MVGTEAGRVGEGGGLAHAAAGGHRIQVADGRALAPDAAGVLDELVDAERGQPVRLADVLDEPEPGAPGDYTFLRMATFAR